ncbi:MAG: sigma-70 family RNA polymerase sigma factor, partial [Anaerolineae bacterium]|nr:sigma-70 family RNA polymerase sigma factor [Anaerolineae bacterium]
RLIREKGSSMPSSPDEQTLLERAQQYDANALGELYSRYAPRIYSYILYQVSDEKLAEDLAANVFSKMLAAIQTSKAWQQSFVSWLYRIAHNVVVDHFRHFKHGRDLPLDEGLISADLDPVSTVEHTLSHEAVMAAMHVLTEDQRTVIVLKFFEGLSNVEAARVMGKTEGAIKSLQYRALGALRRELDEVWGRIDA